MRLPLVIALVFLAVIYALGVLLAEVAHHILGAQGW